MGDGVVVADTARQVHRVQSGRAADPERSLLRRRDPTSGPAHHGLFLPDMVTLYPSDQLPFVRAIRGESVDGAEIFVRPAGATEGKWVSVTARPLREEDGEIRGGVVVLRDITAPKHAAEALELAKQRGRNRQPGQERVSFAHEPRAAHSLELDSRLRAVLELQQLGEQATRQRLPHSERRVSSAGSHQRDSGSGAHRVRPSGVSRQSRFGCGKR